MTNMSTKNNNNTPTIKKRELDPKLADALTSGGFKVVRFTDHMMTVTGYRSPSYLLFVLLFVDGERSFAHVLKYNADQTSNPNVTEYETWEEAVETAIVMEALLK